MSRALAALCIVLCSATAAHAQDGGARRDPVPPVPVPAPVPPDDEGDDEEPDVPPEAPDEGLGGAAAKPEEPPPLVDVWTQWAIRAAPGTRLLEDEATLREVLEPYMKVRQALTPGAREDLVAACADLGYYLENVELERPAAGEVVATLVLRPLQVVRRVDVDIDVRVYEVLSHYWIQNEMQRRMKLRVGEVIQVDREAQQTQLNDEAQRLEEFLHDEGFFEARVVVRITPSGVYGAIVHVDATLGPGYKVGEIRLQPETGLALPAGEIKGSFRHCGFWLFGCLREKRFSRSRHQADIQALTAKYQRRGYPAARIRSDYDAATSFDRSSKKVDFTLRIDERRRLAVEFEGNGGRFSDDVLDRQLTFDDAASADDVEIAASALAIQRYYQRAGWFDAAVSWERDRKRVGDAPAGDDRSFDLVRFRIDAGERRALRTVEIVGERQIAEDELRSVLELSPVDDSFKLLGDDAEAATTERLIGDAQRLIQLYRSRGYLEAEVQVHASPAAPSLGDAALTAATIGAEQAPRDLHVRFTITEGERTEIAVVDAVGMQVASKAQVLEVVDIDPGAPYDESELEAAEQRLRDFYFRIGRPRAEVQHDVDDADPLRRTVTFVIDEHQEVRIGTVLVRGNFRTDRWVILDELGLDEGTLITTDTLSRAVRRLRATGLFAAVELNMLDFDDTREEQVNAVVRVEERNDVRLYADLEAGLSTEKGAYGRFAPVAPNYFGNGIQVQLGLTFGADPDGLNPFAWEPKFESEDFSIRIPRWVNRRYLKVAPDVEISGLRRIQDTERFGELETWNGTIAASRLYQRDPGNGRDARSISLTGRYDFRIRNRQDDTVRVAGGAATTDRTAVTNQAGIIGGSITWEQRVDEAGNLNPLVPHRGFKLEVGGGFASRWLGGKDDFVKLSALGQWIRQLSNRVQLRVEGRYDQGIPIGGAALLPEVERFFAGGDDSVRGFGEDRLEIEIIEEPVPPFGGLTQVRVLPAGGNIRALASVDLQVELAKVGSLPLASALFVDVGAITNVLPALDPTDIRPSAGIALARLLTPLGGLSLEWAIPLLPRTYDPPQGRLHFVVALRY